MGRVDKIKDAMFTSPQMGEVDIESLSSDMRTMMVKLYELTGVKVPPEETLTASSMSLATTMKERFPILTKDEVWIALENGALGEYPGDRKISVANMVSWANAYGHSYDRKVALEMAARIAGTSGDAKSMTDEEVAEANKNAMIRGARMEWNMYKMYGKLNILLDGYAAAICDYLMEIGKMKPTEQTIRDAWKASRSTLAQRRGELSSKLLMEEFRMDYATKRELLERYFRSLDDRKAELYL